MKTSAWIQRGTYPSHGAASTVRNQLNAGLGAYARHAAWVRYVAATQSYVVLQHRSRVAAV